MQSLMEWAVTDDTQPVQQDYHKWDCALLLSFIVISKVALEKVHLRFSLHTLAGRVCVIKEFLIIRSLLLAIGKATNFQENTFLELHNKRQEKREFGQK